MGIVVLLVGAIWIRDSFSGSSGAAGAIVLDDGSVAITTVLEGFKYNPDTITVKKGSRIRLTIENKDNVLHGLHLPQFGIVDSTPALTSKTVEFNAVESPTNGQAVPTCAQEHGETLTFNVV